MKAEGRVGVFDVYGFEKVVPALLKLEVAKVWIGVDITPSLQWGVCCAWC